MKAMRGYVFVLASLVGGLCVSFTLSAEPASKDKSPDKSDNADLVTEAVAKDRAVLMHDVVMDTLEVMHHRYFRRDGSILPARALNDVFARIDRRSGTKVRWIAVNTPPMSLDHEAESAFEKKAVEVLSSGKSEYVAIEKGHYLRAAPVPLGAGCVGCHTKFTPTTDKKPRFAGLVVSIPLKTN